MKNKVITLSLGILILCLLGSQATANEIDDRQGYEQELNDKFEDLKEESGGYQRQYLISVKSVPKNIDPWQLSDKLEQAFNNDDFPSAVSILKDASLTFTLNPQFPLFLTVHPYQPKNRAYEIVKALINDDKDAVMLAIESSGTSLDDIVYYETALGETPLTMAILKANADAVTSLLSAGASPETSAAFSGTPMTRAIAVDNIDAVFALLEAGADINTRVAVPSYGPTLLSYAASTGNSNLLTYLIDRGADADIGDGYGWTPLMDAVHAQDWDLIQRLLPLSNPGIVSTREINEFTSDKGLDRFYPRSNALYVAEQINTPLGEKIHAALLAKVAESGDTIDTVLLTLQNIRNTMKAASHEGRLADAIASADQGIALVVRQQISTESHGDLVNHAISILMDKHELAVMTGSSLGESERALTQHLFDMGSQSRKWHDMLDIFHAAKTTYPQQQIDQWQQQHGSPSRKGWNFGLLIDWIESFDDDVTRDRLYDTLDFFELN